jgi:hypothetical protein
MGGPLRTSRVVVVRIAPAILLAGCLGAVAPCCLGADAGTAAAQPTTRPASEIDALIGQLGDPSFAVRRDASARLRDLGRAALPELREAAQGNDPEIRARASQIVRVLEYRPIPGRPRMHGFARQRRVSYRLENGRRSVDVDDLGRRIKISQGDDGIVMTITGETDGAPDTEVYRARTPEQLQADNAEAYAVYQRYAQAAGAEADGQFQGNVIIQRNGQLILVPRFQPAPIAVPRGGDDLTGLRDRLDDAMNKSNLPPVQRARVHNAIDQIQQSGSFDPAATPLDGEDDQIARYDKACDDLRKLTQDLHLPDPGEALPPPKSARLGVNVTPEPLSNAIVVAHVLPHSRAERIGLQDDDVIHKINGKPVADVKELRRLVTENPKNLVIDVTRDGRDMKLQEKN